MHGFGARGLRHPSQSSGPPGPLARWSSGLSHDCPLRSQGVEQQSVEDAGSDRFRNKDARWRDRAPGASPPETGFAQPRRADADAEKPHEDCPGPGGDETLGCLIDLRALDVSSSRDRLWAERNRNPDDSDPVPDHVFTADRPFPLLIRKSATGVILFVGRVLNPAAWRKTHLQGV